MGLECDVVVVGTGAGGSPVALSLARAGARVVLIDRGRRFKRSDFVHDEILMARREFFTPSAAMDPNVLVVENGEPEKTADGWVSVCVGGGTVHMSGFFYRFLESDFRVAEILGSITGSEHQNWPVSYAEMAPFYDMVDAEIGVSGPADEGPFAAKRSAPYPFTAVETHPAGALIDGAARGLGLHPFVTPRAIITADRPGRGRCTYCHLCGGFGCEVGAKSSTLDTLIPAAEATGKCQVLADARVFEVRVDDAGRATGVVYRDALGQEHEVKARAVVLACSTVQTARLLLMSKSSRFQNGLGNGDGQVGAHLMFSTLSKAHGSFRFAPNASRAELLKDYAPFLGRSLLDHYVPKQAPVQKAGGLNFLFPSGGPVFQSETVAMRNFGTVIWGKRLKDELRAYWHEQKQMDCETFGEYLPTPGTRVELDTDVKDAAGFPAARIRIERHPHDLKVSQYLADRASEILSAAGADKVWQSNLGGRTMHLPMGACRMGKDPKSSATTPECQLHGVKNVFVSDGSVFPSSGGVPPTYTILANSFRVGKVIAERFMKKEL